MTDATFFPGLRIAGGRYWIAEPVTVSRYGDGSVYVDSLGAALWAAEVRVAAHLHHAQVEAEALVARAARPGQTVFAYDSRRNGPRLDPGGVILGASSPQIAELDADNRRLRVSGLPAGYELSVGDLIGWQYGSSPTRYAHHRIASAATASGAGLTGLFEVEPHIRPGASVGAAVSLVRPVFKAVVTAADYGGFDVQSSAGAVLSLLQTFR